MPVPHERVRQLDDRKIEIVFTKEELLALLEAVAQCDPDFGFTFTRPMVNKPEERKQRWKKINRQRIDQRKAYRGYRSSRRH